MQMILRFFEILIEVAVYVASQGRAGDRRPICTACRLRRHILEENCFPLCSLTEYSLFFAARNCLNCFLGQKLQPNRCM